MKKLWKIYLSIAFDLNGFLIGLDLGLFCSLVIGIVLILLHNNGNF